jgi:hypothetical protein
LLSFGIPLEVDTTEGTVVDLNGGGELLTKNFPRDTDFGLVAFRPREGFGEAVSIADLMTDIEKALCALDEGHVRGVKRHGWYKRLNLYSSK